MLLPKTTDQRTTDFLNALEAITVLGDIAKRNPEIIILAGLVLLFVGLLIL